MTERPAEKPERVPTWPFGDMIRMVLAIQWDFPETTYFVPMAYRSKTGGHQYVIWPLTLPPGAVTEEPE